MDREGVGEAFPQLLAAAQAGAGWALERVWQSYAAKVAGYLRVQGADDPEDLASEVFLGAFRAISTFSGDEPQFRSWLFTIAHRRLLDARRSRSRAPSIEPLDDAHDAPAGDAADDVLRRLATERVRALCERLVPDQRDVLLLRLVAGMTVEEAASVLGKSPGATKALQRRGLAAIRKILEREGVPL